MIRSSHLSKKYRKKLAVDDLSFDVETGKVTGFLGPNGAGKSTTMRLMLGLNSGHGSTTFTMAKNSNSIPSHPKWSVYCLRPRPFIYPVGPQPFAHFGHYGRPYRYRPSASTEVLDIVGLADAWPKKGHVASSRWAMAQRLRAFAAAAILGKPKYLLLDEPANGLDPEGIAWLRDFLKSYADQGNAVLVSSHLLSEMSQMADNVVVIGKGKLIVSSPVKQLLSDSSASSVFVRATPACSSAGKSPQEPPNLA